VAVHRRWCSCAHPCPPLTFGAGQKKTTALPGLESDLIDAALVAAVIVTQIMAKRAVAKPEIAAE